MSDNPAPTPAPAAEVPPPSAAEPPAGLSARSARKREAILEAAEALFCEAGYPGTSMDAVAARAGVSKATLYAHFPSKNDLFASVLRKVADPYVRVPAELIDHPPAEALPLIAHRFIDMVTTPRALTVYRTLLSQGAVFPEMVEAFRSAGPRPVVAAVAAYFRAQDEAGHLRVPNPELTASMFLHLVKAEAHAQALIGGACAGVHSQDEYVREAVRLFLVAYAPEGA